MIEDSDLIILEQNNLSICLKEDQQICETINQAIDSLNKNEFAFFDLELSEWEIQALNSTKISRFQNWGISDDELNYLPKIVEVFLNNFVLDQPEPTSTTTMVNLITKLVRAVMSESNHNSCKVTLRTHPSNKNHTNFWHIDKTHEEIIGMNSNLTQDIFIITLKGASTLFYSLNHDLHDHWIKIAEEHLFSYSTASYMLSNQTQEFSAITTKQGSIHKANRKYGAIHTPPYPENGRFLILIEPNNKETIQALERFEDYHLSNT